MGCHPCTVSRGPIEHLAWPSTSTSTPEPTSHTETIQTLLSFSFFPLMWALLAVFRWAVASSWLSLLLDYIPYLLAHACFWTCAAFSIYLGLIAAEFWRTLEKRIDDASFAIGAILCVLLMVVMGSFAAVAGILSLGSAALILLM
ncbi:hypothetical protein DFJ74DRAFT_670387 [Hyaloraphidium curvatum]|nr:hypothetical protein DFJ74DRAFT_670387 [Hyaloraphidium curvatum]